MIASTTVFCPKELRSHVLDTLFSKHYNQHMLIPDANGNHSAAEIRHQAVKEMYEFCKEKNLDQLWAYMWNSWYSPKSWRLWARSANITIARLRTTMIIESHWCHLKHDYLHHFSRPRLDLLIHVLLNKLQPEYLKKLRQLQLNSIRPRGLPSWKRDFKREWRKLERIVVNRTYSTNASNWTCTCPAYVSSRFLLCKHLVKNVQKIPRDSDFFRVINRQRSIPFYQHQDLIPIRASIDEDEEREANTSNVSTVSLPSAVDTQSDSDSDVSLPEFVQEGIVGNETGLEGGSGSDSETEIRRNWDDEVHILRERLEKVMQMVEEQGAAGGDVRFLDVVNRKAGGLFRMVDDVHKMQRRAGPFPRTWRDFNENTMYAKYTQ